MIFLYDEMILIDLQKAFDTRDHEMFLKKIKCIGFSESAIGWYKSYLEDRFFCCLLLVQLLKKPV